MQYVMKFVIEGRYPLPSFKKRCRKPYKNVNETLMYSFLGFLHDIPSNYIGNTTTYMIVEN